MTRLVAASALLAGVAALAAPRAAQPTKGGGFADKPTPEQVAFFEKKIRPVLVDQCYECHSADAEKIKGGLTLDTRDGIRKGGDSGPAVVPGNPDRSLLIKVAAAQGPRRPRCRRRAKLPDERDRRLRGVGADGRARPARRQGRRRAKKYEIDIEKGRQFWAFQPPKKAAAAGREERRLAAVRRSTRSSSRHWKRRG